MIKSSEVGKNIPVIIFSANPLQKMHPTSHNLGRNLLIQFADFGGSEIAFNTTVLTGDSEVKIIGQLNCSDVAENNA